MFRDPIVIGLTAVAALVRFTTLDAQSLWYDEALTFDLVNESFGGMVDGALGHEAQPPTYFILAWLWTHVFGDGEVGLRSLSALLGTLTVPVAYAAGRIVAGPRAALLAGALTAFSPALVWYSQEARAYALVTLLSALALLFFLRALDRPPGRDVVLWAIASVLAVASHYFAVFLILPMAAWLLWQAPDRRRLLPYLGGLAVGLLALMPMLLYQREHGGVDWIAEIPLWPRVRDTVFFFVAGPTGISSLTQHRDLVFAAGLVVCALAVAALVRWADAEVRGRALLVFGLAAAVLGGPFLLSYAGSDFVLDRNFLPAWVPLAIVVAAGLSVGPLRPAGPAVVAGTCAAFALVVVVAVPRNPDRQRHDWRAVAEAIGPSEEPHVVALSPFWHGKALRIYTPMIGLDVPYPVRKVVTVELETFVPFGDLVTTAAPGPPFRQTSWRRLPHFTVVEYTAPRAVRVDPRALRGEGPNRAEAFVTLPR